jgi:hypothetical protein
MSKTVHCLHTEKPRPEGLTWAFRISSPALNDSDSEARGHRRAWAWLDEFSVDQTPFQSFIVICVTKHKCSFSSTLLDLVAFTAAYQPTSFSFRLRPGFSWLFPKPPPHQPLPGDRGIDPTGNAICPAHLLVNL